MVPQSSSQRGASTETFFLQPAGGDKPSVLPVPAFACLYLSFQKQLGEVNDLNSVYIARKVFAGQAVLMASEEIKIRVGDKNKFCNMTRAR